ncbi:MAG TPA: ubiquinone/menaquinone biosynthesis methyltransferase [Candidatus Krumholzibacterium sp.]|nr:ubiquinone/menaquinone biosynthesis methyltransferase [Candidatus Krumholzibacterium sp.]
MNERADNQGRFLRGVYSRIHGRYELTNHVLTFGLDIIWRRKAAKLAAGYFARRRSIPGESPGEDLILDVCTGTGEMAGLLRRRAQGGTTVLGLDFSKEMLLEAAVQSGPFGTSLICADMDDIPFPDDTFDIVTMAFAMRNNNPDGETLSRRLGEIRRILRPGGVFVNLETSRPSSAVLRHLRDLYAKYFVAGTGGSITGDRSGFRYLSSSIRSFYGSDELGRIFEKAGLEKVEIRKLSLGMTAIHAYRKPA